MSTKGQIGIKGLKTSGNRLTFGPGALTAATNCVIPSKDELTPRHGQMLQSEYVSGDNGYIDGDSTDANSNRAKEIYQWGTALYVNYTGSGGYKLASFANWATSPSRALVGSYAPPEPTITRMKFATLAKSLYWTTDAGLATVDAVGGTARAAGMRQPEGVIPAAAGGLAGNPNASGSWLAKNTAIGLRATIGIKDANGIPHISAACGRLVVVNPNDETIAIGSLIRDTNVVTATLSAGATHSFQVGDILNLTLTGADVGNFDATDNVVTSVTSTTIVWAETAANYTNVAEVTITSGVKYLQYGVFLPPGLSTSHFVQVYRTDEVTGDTSDPGDEMFLAYERYLTSTDISNRFTVITDRTPSGRLGDPLDSNANSGEGQYGQNYRPPLARDICAWDNRLWAFQTTDPHKIRMRLLGTGTPDGLQSADVICLHTIAMVAGTDFTLYTQFAASQNVRRTLSALVNGLNYTLNSTSYVLQLLMDGDDNETWGAFSFEEDGVGGSALYAGTTRTSAFAEPLATVVAVTEASTSRLSNVVTVTTGSAHGFSTGDSIVLAANALAGEADFPTGVKTPITVTGGTTFTYAETGNNATMSGTPAYWVYKATFKSDNNQQPVRCSRAGIPEAWPLTNTLGGLPDGAEVLRGVPSGSGYSLMLFLKDGAIYRVSGEFPYVVRRLDDTASLLGADTVGPHAGKLHAFTTQGLVTVTEGGVGIVGGDVEDSLRSAWADIVTNSLDKSVLFGVSHESDRQYQCWVTSGALAYASSTYVYHSLFGQFTKWSANRTCGLVFRGTDRLVMGDVSTNQLRIERRFFGSDEWKSYADEIVGSSTIASKSGQNITLNAAVVAVSGYVAYNSTRDEYRLITAVSGGFTIFTLLGDLANWVATDTVKAYKSISASLTLAPDVGGAPGIEKRWREVQAHFGDLLAYQLFWSFTNERAASGSVTRTDSNFAISTPTTGVRLERVAVPLAAQMGSALTVTLSLSEAFSYFHLYGLSATSEVVSERTGKP